MMSVPLLLVLGSAFAYMAEMLIVAEELGAMVPKLGEMSNHVAEG